MRKIIAILLVLLAVTPLFGCQSKQEENGANLPNPVQEYKSLDEINNESQIVIVSAPVAGKGNEKFYVINNENKVSEYWFDVNGLTYTLRASKQTDSDISGLYYEGNTFEENADSIFMNSEYKMARFFTSQGQYVLAVNDAGALNENTFRDIACEIANVNGATLYDGYYADKVSQRAMMTIINNGGINEIEVKWSSGATNTTVWTMNAKVKDGKLEYSGENIDTYTYYENGEATIDSTASNNLGYFEIVDGCLAWTGAAQEQCQTCIFEKIPYASEN